MYYVVSSPTFADIILYQRSKIIVFFMFFIKNICLFTLFYVFLCFFIIFIYISCKFLYYMFFLTQRIIQEISCDK